MAEAEAAAECERGRRREVEAALREASAIFKRELADKNGQLDLLRQQVGCGTSSLATARFRRMRHLWLRV